MKAIRIELFQQLPNYRKPASFLVKESYPMPPYSTVMGMIHTSCGFESTHDMKLCIQSEHASETVDLATLYNFGIPYNEKRHFAKVLNSKGKYDGINKGVRGVHLLTDVKIIIYIVPQDDDYNTILEGMCSPKNYISIGRYEDIARIDTVEEVELEKYEYDEDEEYENIIPYDMYVPVEMITGAENGSIYNLRKKYTLDNKSGMRNWDSIIKVKHISSGTGGSNIKGGFLDKKNKCLVCLA
ncbi:MAG: CRISPR-associated protein Cas5 [Clostridia bacterium]|jgi:CRISPR-associated protein Cas5t|nr:CRISPR-associated protein Cas5 [Clostridia bacterium]MCI2001242.1 CRISPR-associated protein Cas5 [Clostridia bacterium]MCI2015952.1 CRISPR-associated protein Cas5 [Clostridia bacterium]